MSLSPCIGVLMLDTAFPRIVGDAGNAQSYAMPVQFAVVHGAGSLDIVRAGRPSEHLVQAFCEAAQKLEKQGAKAIVSTCGFLLSVQNTLAQSVNIPVMLSALSLYPTLAAALGGRSIGILTACAPALDQNLLDCAGIDAKRVCISGLEDVPAFAQAILQAKEQQPGSIDSRAIERAVVSKAQAQLRQTPDIGAFLFECGNLPPYAKAVYAATGKPVFSILDAAKLLTNG